MVLAGIVSYNPNIERLLQNIEAVINQVDKLLIVDNGSTNINDIERICNEKSIEMISYKKNLGIAYALNEIMNFADRNNFEWYLTLDQDSVIESNLVKNYLRFDHVEKVAMMTCIVKDRNIDNQEESMHEDYIETNLCITSGNLCNTKIIKKLNGYDDELFIDLVDLDICHRVRMNNYLIIKINYTGILHELGASEIKKIFGRQIVVANENPQRIYFIARNTVLLLRKYRDIQYLNLLLNNMIRVLFIEKGRTKRIIPFFVGISHGIKGKTGFYKIK